eukprot:TRINITY_DN34374_c0_g1_i1.p1 TRINITY_DN34374_c0_g1~~TRINITY_DN34374_c0_g1_i1.p1  ORF type:complete len:532 (+),score=123.88 TRINITY_DN34374_c0_g1_i1:84-1679(+)
MATQPRYRSKEAVAKAAAVAKAKEIPEDGAAMDEQEMRAIFDKIDLDHGGTLDLGELECAARELGVSCSKNSLKKVFKMIDLDGSGEIDFEEFKIFFGKVTSPDTIKDILAASSARFLDYRFRVEKDPGFAKAFPMPPTVKNIQKYEGAHNGNVESVKWLDNFQFVSASSEGLALVWDASAVGGRPQPVIKSQLECRNLYSMDANARNGHKILVGNGGQEDNCLLWDLAESRRLMSYQGHASAVYCCNLTQHGVVSGAKDGMICLNDLEREAPVLTWSFHDGVVHSVKMSPDGRKVVSSSRDGQVLFVDTRTGNQVGHIEDAAAGYSVNAAIWIGMEEVATAGDDYCVKRWDSRMTSNPPLDSYMGHTSGVRSLVLSDDEQFFVSGADNGAIRMWIVDANKSRDKLGMPHKEASVEAIRDRLGALAQQREEELELFHQGEGDPAKVKAITEEMERLEGDAKGLAEADSKAGSTAIQCVQASLDLKGPSMNCCALDFKAGEGTTVHVVGGSYDESAYQFSVDTNDVTRSLWD